MGEPADLPGPWGHNPWPLIQSKSPEFHTRCRTPRINGEIRNGLKMGFHFRPVFKSENSQRFVSCLTKKPAQIIGALKRALIVEWQNISDTVKRTAIKTWREGWLPL